LNFAPKRETEKMYGCRRKIWISWKGEKLNLCTTTIERIVRNNFTKMRKMVERTGQQEKEEIINEMW